MCVRSSRWLHYWWFPRKQGNFINQKGSIIHTSVISPVHTQHQDDLHADLLISIRHAHMAHKNADAKEHQDVDNKQTHVPFVTFLSVMFWRLWKIQKKEHRRFQPQTAVPATQIISCQQNLRSMISVLLINYYARNYSLQMKTGTEGCQSQKHLLGPPSNVSSRLILLLQAQFRHAIPAATYIAEIKGCKPAADHTCKLLSVLLQ